MYFPLYIISINYLYYYKKDIWTATQTVYSEMQHYIEEQMLTTNIKNVIACLALKSYKKN